MIFSIMKYSYVKFLRILRDVFPATCLLGGFGSANPAMAREQAGDPLFVLSAEYAADIVTVAQGANDGTRFVDLLTVAGELDLDKAAGWNGARMVAQVLAGTGGRPNDLAGTLQGVNNIEVSKNRVKLYQFYLDQQFAQAPVSLRLGFVDLNEEFYSNDAAGLLVAPAFGIGSELSATGPNGPSIFPSTALTARVRIEPSKTVYAQFAVVNAEAGVLGDRGGVHSLFRNGALLIGEAGTTRFGKLAAGVWTYTERQDDIRLIDSGGDPLRKRARGAYALFEMPFARQAGPDGETSDKVTGFLRAGISDGNTTPFKGGWQAGVLVNGVFPGRPDSQLSIGANQAFLARKYRLNGADAGDPQRGAETGLEITYSDKVAPWLTIQPDAQYVWTASKAPGARDAVILGIRFTITQSREW